MSVLEIGSAATCVTSRRHSLYLINKKKLIQRYTYNLEASNFGCRRPSILCVLKGNQSLTHSLTIITIRNIIQKPYFIFAFKILPIPWGICIYSTYRAIFHICVKNPANSMGYRYIQYIYSPISYLRTKSCKFHQVYIHISNSRTKSCKFQGVYGIIGIQCTVYPKIEFCVQIPAKFMGICLIYIVYSIQFQEWQPCSKCTISAQPSSQCSICIFLGMSLHKILPTVVKCVQNPANFSRVYNKRYCICQ